MPSCPADVAYTVSLLKILMMLIGSIFLRMKSGINLQLLNCFLKSLKDVFLTLKSVKVIQSKVLSLMSLVSSGQMHRARLLLA